MVGIYKESFAASLCNGFLVVRGSALFFCKIEKNRHALFIHIVIFGAFYTLKCFSYTVEPTDNGSHAANIRYNEQTVA